MRTVLTIAGSDPSGGAGIQADLKTFAALGLYGVSAITAVTVQSTKGVEETAPLSSDLVTAQIEAIAGDITLHATKLGMMGTAAIVEAVAAAIAEVELPLVVLDPVLVSSSGAPLLDDEGVRMLCVELLAKVRVVTPNLAEAEALTGRHLESFADVRAAAQHLHGMGAAAVIITGGHASWHGDEGSGSSARHADVVDLLFDGDAFHELRVARVDGPPLHGTGCAFASAVAAGLALGFELPDAAARAQRYVAGAIAHALTVGKGRAVLDHFWARRTDTRPG
jgi:hydroxymethylpyrimidine/phosphomethylpyrimidine kinase